MKTIKVEGKSLLEVKRFYLPVKFKVNCAHCGNEVEVNLSEQYLSYPTLNKTEDRYFYCDECDEESKLDLTLRISLEVGEEVTKA